MARELLPAGYDDLLRELKERIQQAQVCAALAVNRELVLLYWHIGHDILVRQDQEGWGTKVIDRLSADLRREFPEMKGFSLRNLKYMRAFAEAYPDESIVQQAAAQLPWFHNCLLLDKVRDATEREWYSQRAPSSMAGAATSLPTRSTPASMHAKGKLSPTSIAPCRQRNPISHSSSSKTPTTSTSSPSARRRTNAISNAACSSTFATSCWS